MENERDPLLSWLPKLSPKADKEMRKRVIQDLMVRTQTWILARQMKGIKAPVKEDEEI